MRGMPLHVEADCGREIRVARNLRNSCPPCVPESYPPRSQRVPRLSKFCRTVALGAEFLAEVGPSLAEIVRIWPELPNFWPNSTKLVQLGRSRANFGQDWPRSASVGRDRPKDGQTRLTFGQIRPESRLLWQLLDNFQTTSDLVGIDGSNFPGRDGGNVSGTSG